jgi:hypothetical protein
MEVPQRGNRSTERLFKTMTPHARAKDHHPFLTGQEEEFCAGQIGGKNQASLVVLL